MNKKPIEFKKMSSEDWDKVAKESPKFYNELIDVCWERALETLDEADVFVILPHKQKYCIDLHQEINVNRDIDGRLLNNIFWKPLLKAFPANNNNKEFYIKLFSSVNPLFLDNFMAYDFITSKNDDITSLAVFGLDTRCLNNMLNRTKLENLSNEVVYLKKMNSVANFISFFSQQNVTHTSLARLVSFAQEEWADPNYSSTVFQMAVEKCPEIITSLKNLLSSPHLLAGNGNRLQQNIERYEAEQQRIILTQTVEKHFKSGLERKRKL